MPESQQGNHDGFPRAQELLDAYTAGRRNFSDTSWTEVSLAEASLVGCNLENSIFDNCILAFADLSKSNLRGSRFQKCNLIGCKFQECDLTEVDFEPSALVRGDFFKADLTRTNLSNCNLKDSFLMQAKLVETRLYQASLSGAVFGATAINNVHLLTTELSDIQHGLPSYVDAATIDNVRDDLIHARYTQQMIEADSEVGSELRSKLGADASQKIEQELRQILPMIRQFLLRTGMRKDDLERIDALAPNLQDDFASVFISYSSEDEDFARYLDSQLRLYGVNVWFAPNNIRGGRKIYEQVDRAIRDQDKVILILSEASMRSSWVATELITAFDREQRTGHQVLYPIRIVGFNTVRAWKLFDADSGLDIARRVREYYIPDFSEWKSLFNITEQLSRLVEDLRRDQ